MIKIIFSSWKGIIIVIMLVLLLGTIIFFSRDKNKTESFDFMPLIIPENIKDDMTNKVSDTIKNIKNDKNIVKK